MKRFKFSILFSLSLFILLLPGFAEEVASVNLQSLDLSQFPLVRIFYNTKDSAGNYSKAVWEDDVQLFEDNLYYRVWGDGDYNHARSNIVMIIDSSGSMRAVMKKVLSAASSLLKEMDGADKIMLIDFDSTVKPVTGFTRDRDELLNNLTKIKADGATALYDSVSVGLHELIMNPEKSDGLNLIVLLTDGKDENASGGPGSKKTFKDLKKELVSTNIPVYSIGLGSNVDRDVLESMSNLSGGKTYYAKDVENLSFIYKDIIGFVHSLHKFDYITANGKWDGAMRNVVISLKQQKKNIGFKYQAPSREKIADTLGIFGNRISYADLSKQKTAIIEWSYCFTPFGGKSGRFVSNLAISPDGKFIFEGEVLGILNNKGERLFLGTYDAMDSFNINVSDHLYQYTHGYGYLGEIYGFDDVRNLVDLDTIKKKRPQNIEMPGLNYPSLLNSAKGDFHMDWLNIDHSYKPVSLSKGGRFIVFTASPDNQEYEYFYLLYDMKDKRILWEKGFYKGDFGEPGSIKVSDSGFTLITQDYNIFGVDSGGNLKLKLMWESSGMRFSRLDINGDGSSFVGLYKGKKGMRFGYFDLTGLKSGKNVSVSIKPVFSVEARPNDKPGCISISANGSYMGFNDRYGPKIFNKNGGLIWKLDFTEPIYSYNSGNGFYIIDNGTFVFSEVNRFYYGRLKDL